MRMGLSTRSVKEVKEDQKAGAKRWVYGAGGSTKDDSVCERRWEIVADEESIRKCQKGSPKRYAAFHVGITLITWALRPDDFMERLKDAMLPIAVDNDLADAMLTLLGVAFDETNSSTEE